MYSMLIMLLARNVDTSSGSTSIPLMHNTTCPPPFVEMLFVGGYTSNSGVCITFNNSKPLVACRFSSVVGVSTAFSAVSICPLAFTTTSPNVLVAVLSFCALATIQRVKNSRIEIHLFICQCGLELKRQRIVGHKSNHFFAKCRIFLMCYVSSGIRAVCYVSYCIALVGEIAIRFSPNLAHEGIVSYPEFT